MRRPLSAAVFVALIMLTAGGPASRATFILGLPNVVSAQGNGPGFHVSAGGDLNCPGGQTLSLPAPPASLGPITIPCTSGQGIAAAEADAGRLRALGRSEHACCGTASGGNGSARILIENVVITGPPAASIPISLNFHLRGTLTGNRDFGQTGIYLFLALRGFNADLAVTSQIDMNPTGVLNKTGVFAPLDVPFPVAAIDQSFTTPVANAGPNVPLTLEFQLLAGSAMAGIGAAESDFFSGSNGFSLPFGVPVFNLPPGYNIDIPALGIVNNFWQAAVPPDVSVTPLDQNFGSVTVGSQSTALVTVTNTGGPGLQVNTVGLGAGSTAFSIVSVRKDGANAVLPVPLDTNETLDVELAFTPTAAGAATRSLVINSNDADESTVVIALTGNGVQIQSPPSEQIADLLSFFDASVTAGTLQGAGFGKSASGRLKALRNMIEAAADFIDAFNAVEACQQLQDVLDRVDGNPRPPDFATGPALDELRSRIIELRAQLGCV